MIAEEYVVYILKCADGTLYTGWTNNLVNRLAAHQSGKGAKYTRARLPVEIVYQERCDTKRQAMQREYQIKQLTRKQKLKLISSD